MRKFYRTVLTIEVLTEDIPYEGGIDEIAFDVFDGECSGFIVEREFKQVEGPKMAELLIGQGSNPQFFQLDENGLDIS